MYVYDTASPQNTSQHGVVLVNTVADNASRYTPADYLRAQKARRLQVVIGRPSLKDYLHIVNNNLLPNCPITAQDTMAAEDIFGPKIGSLQGKTTRRQPHQVNPVWVPILPTVHERYKDVTLGGDVMFVNGQPFLTTISRNIHPISLLLRPSKTCGAYIQLGGSAYSSFSLMANLKQPARLLPMRSRPIRISRVKTNMSATSNIILGWSSSACRASITLFCSNGSQLHDHGDGQR